MIQALTHDFDTVVFSGTLKNGRISTRNKKKKISELCKAIYFRISRPNIRILLLLKGSFWEFPFLCLDLQLINSLNAVN